MISRTIAKTGKSITRSAIRQGNVYSIRQLSAVRPPAPDSNNDSKSKTNQNPRQKSFLTSPWLPLAALGAFGFFLFSRREKAEPKPSLDSIVSRKPERLSVIFVLGGPGAGKGTQCANLVRDYGFVHLSAGDLLRAEQARPGSQYGQLIADYIKTGKIVPQEVTIGLLKNAISDAEKQGKFRFLIDGFPRKMDQAVTFEEQVVVSDFTLYFQCPENVMLQRLLKRGESSGRSDDNIDSIKKRFQTFVDTSMPVVDHFAKLNKVVTVHCDHTPEKVYEDVRQALNERGITPVESEAVKAMKNEK